MTSLRPAALLIVACVFGAPLSAAADGVELIDIHGVEARAESRKAAR